MSKSDTDDTGLDFYILLIFIFQSGKKARTNVL